MHKYMIYYGYRVENAKEPFRGNYNDCLKKANELCNVYGSRGWAHIYEGEGEGEPLERLQGSDN